MFFFFYLTDSLSLGVNFSFCMEVPGKVTNVDVKINMIGLYLTMIDRLRQLSEPRLRQQAKIEKSQTPTERDILAQWVRIFCLGLLSQPRLRKLSHNVNHCFVVQPRYLHN